MGLCIVYERENNRNNNNITILYKGKLKDYSLVTNTVSYHSFLNALRSRLDKVFYYWLVEANYVKPENRERASQEEDKKDAKIIDY